MDGDVIASIRRSSRPRVAASGIGFAIPSNLAREVTKPSLRSRHCQARLDRVRIQPVTPEIAEGLGLPARRARLIADVTKADGGAGRTVKAIWSRFGRQVRARRPRLPRSCRHPIGKAVSIEGAAQGPQADLEDTVAESCGRRQGGPSPSRRRLRRSRTSPSDADGSHLGR